MLVVWLVTAVLHHPPTIINNFPLVTLKLISTIISWNLRDAPYLHVFSAYFAHLMYMCWSNMNLRDANPQMYIAPCLLLEVNITKGPKGKRACNLAPTIMQV